MRLYGAGYCINTHRGAGWLTEKDIQRVTQPADVGWSRHESFGEEPCLACLYVPTGRRPSQHELVSRALRQPELRVLAYLTFRVPVDSPLRPEQIPRLPNHPVPQDASTWVSQSILEDIGQR